MKTADWNRLDETIQDMTRDEKRALIHRLQTSLEPVRKEINLEEARRLIHEIASMPIQSPDDGFSGRDHDEVLYGWKK